MTLMRAEDISVTSGGTMLLEPLSLNLEAGEPLVILGETGSGKSLMAQALMGTLPNELQAKGRIAIGDHILNAASPKSFRRFWGRQIGVLPQEPWLSLDPLMPAHNQVAEAYRLVRGFGRSEARQMASSDLSALGLADSQMRFPHQLSGGMAQRVVIAAARAGGANIVIADEPTKGLDTALRDNVANLLLGAMGESGGLIIITHDLALARRVGGRLIVLRNGHVVESGSTAEIFAAPRAAYTRDLFAADPESWSPRASSKRDTNPVIRVEDLAVARGTRTLFEGVNLEIVPGSVFGVTGPSGCGKSSLGDAILGLLPPVRGHITRNSDHRSFAFQKLYQDPVASFPRKRLIGETINDILRLTQTKTNTVDTLMERLDLDPALLKRLPTAVSGGELQRLSLLRVLLRNPAFIFADEPTSRLDPITQAKVIAMLTETAEQDGVAVMLVSHDRALIDNTADTVLPLDGVGDAPIISPESAVTSASYSNA